MHYYKSYTIILFSHHHIHVFLTISCIYIYSCTFTHTLNIPSYTCLYTFLFTMHIQAHITHTVLTINIHITFIIQITLLPYSEPYLVSMHYHQLLHTIYSISYSLYHITYMSCIFLILHTQTPSWTHITNSYTQYIYVLFPHTCK